MITLRCANVTASADVRDRVQRHAQGSGAAPAPRDPDDAGNLQHQFMLRLLFYTAVRVSELVNIDSSSKSGVGSMRSFLIGMHTKTFGWGGRECSAF